MNTLIRHKLTLVALGNPRQRVPVSLLVSSYKDRREWFFSSLVYKVATVIILINPQGRVNESVFFRESTNGAVYIVMGWTWACNG